MTLTGARACSFEGVRQLLCARLELFEQAHVLDRDHGLVGENLGKLDLLVGERTHLRPGDGDGADGNTFSEHRYRKHSAVAVTGRVSFCGGELGVRLSQQIGDMHHGAVDKYWRVLLPCRGRAEALQIRWDRSVVSGYPVPIAFDTQDVSIAGAAQLHGDFWRSAIQHRLQVRRRAADDSQDLAGRSLLLQSIGQRLVRSCSSLNNRTFSIAITAWSAKVFTSVICLSENGTGSFLLPTDTPMGVPSRTMGTASDASVPKLVGARDALSKFLLRRLLQIRHVQNRVVQQGATHHEISTNRSVRSKRTGAVCRSCCNREVIALDQIHRAVGVAAQPRHICRYGVDHRLQIGRGTAHHAQDLAGRGLLFQRFGERRVALPELVEQPHVLDGDDSLVGKRLDQRDLLVGERARTSLCRRDGEGSNQLILLEHRHGYLGASLLASPA